jgi:molecular chaperone GrpE
LTKIKITDEEKTLKEPKGAEEPKESKPEPDLKTKLQETEKEAKENYERYLRVSADMENFKKRVEKEKNETLRFANEEIIKALIPVLDNLERAMDHGRESENSKGLLEGVEMTYKGFLNVFEKFGVSQIEALGVEFDPNLHEAVMVQEDAQEPPGRVISQAQKGYVMHNRLIRPAMVVVSKKPELTEEETEEGTV